MAKVSFDFTHSPQVYRAVMSEAFVIGIRGPRGSGKSTGGVSFILSRAYRQEPDRNRKRRSRWAVIRNTMPELKSTTIKTWLEWVPEGAYTRMTWGSPITFYIDNLPLNDGTSVECEVQFFGLDNPSDVKKVMSYECTGAWVNEARYVPKSVIDTLTESVGRYPSPRDGDPNAVCSQILLDTNSMDADHWWHSTFEGEDQSVNKYVELPDGRKVRIDWVQFVQPPAVLEVQQSGNDYVSIEPGHKGLHFKAAEVIQTANRYWGVNPTGENLANLLPGYYHRQLANKSLEHVQCYAQNKYVFVRDGKPVIPDYVPSQMGRDFPILKNAQLVIGIDDGGGTLNPAAVILQRSPMGAWLAQSEVIGSNMGIDRFSSLLRQHIDETYPGYEISAVWTDPAGENRDEIFETIVNDHLRAVGLPVKAAPTQDPAQRIEAITRPCGRFIDGKPGFLVNTSRCPTLHKALSGAWMFRKVRVSGGERYEEKPTKSHPYSDVGDALGYALVGGGESRIRHPSAASGPGFGGRRGQAVIEFDVF